ncbi:MAG: TRAP transporter substrate-binding protein DctP [Deltaproteobacteria bacterium]|nr:TRAP transporter substrate-binding protein DctP [Deltaproteobacteria bacterium]
MISHVSAARRFSLAMLAACLLLVSPLSGAALAEPVTWKLATIAPKRVGWSILLDTVVAPAVKKATDGTLVFKWYYNGVLGDDVAFVKQIHAGTIQGAGFSGRGVVLAVPEAGVLQLPFLFRGYDEVDYVIHRLRTTLDRYAERRGMKYLYYGDQDFDELYSASVPITKLSDFAGRKFMNWCGPLEAEVLKTLGAIPVSGSVAELSAKIRTGEADAFVAPVFYTVGAQLHAVTKYINTLPIRYSPAGIIIGTGPWKALKAEYRDRLVEGREELAAQFNPKNRAEAKKAVDSMVRYGVKRVETTPAELARLEKQVAPLWKKLAGKDYPKELLDEVLGYLKEYRERAHNAGKNR